MKKLTEKQEHVYRFILDYFEENQISPTQKEIKDYFGFKSYGSVQRYLKYLRDAKLLSGDWNERRGHTPMANEGQLSSIPMLGTTAAGIPVESIELTSPSTIQVPQSMIQKETLHFALKVSGHSMRDKGICEGDIVICRQQHHAKQGQVVIASLSGESTVKSFYQHPQKIELRPANPDYASLFITSEDESFTLLGVLSGLIRNYS